MNGIEYRLYVPAPGATTLIDGGSAIVGERRGDLVDVHYERGGADNVRTFEDRLTHAAGRRAQRYPTSARSVHPAADLIDVGSVRYDGTLRRWVIASVDDPAALCAWSPGPHEAGGSETLRREAAGALYGRLSSAGLADVAIAAAGRTLTPEDVISVASRTGRLR